MSHNLWKSGLAVGWVFFVLIVVVLILVAGMFLKNLPGPNSEASIKPENINDIKLPDSVNNVSIYTDGSLDNNGSMNRSVIQNRPAADNIGITPSQGDSIGAGGGGPSSEPSQEKVVLNIATHYDIREILSSPKPLGDKAVLTGIAFELSGISMFDSFYFTDDTRVMSNPNFLFYNTIDDHITVYNSIHKDMQQGIFSINGTVVKCKNYNDGKYCINADRIE